MRRVDWSLSARRDLSRIRGYIAAFNPYAAERMVVKLAAAAETLADHPERGRRLPRGWREFTNVKSYLIQYSVSDALIRGLRIRHAAHQPRLGVKKGESSNSH